MASNRKQAGGGRAGGVKAGGGAKTGAAEAGAREAAGKPSLYQEVTDRIIAELEAGRAPWAQPWGRAKAGLGLPRNAATGRHYSGVNILILWGAVIEKGFAGQNWLTFRQALDLGGHVRKGERGTTVCYADRFIPQTEIERAQRDGDGEGDKETLQRSVSRPNEAVPFLKRFSVFNADQCDGLPESAFAGAEPLPERQIVAAAEALIGATGADVRIGGDKAFYVPSTDYIQVPPQPAFCYADRFIPQTEIERAQRDGDGEGDKETLQRSVSRPNEAVPFLKRFSVFNADQCDGLPESAFAGAEPLPERQIVAAAEALIGATGADVRIGGDKAFYVPSTDYIQVPPQPAFFQQIDYYRTCFHELGHWSGAKHRLDRDLSGRYGSNPYAREELVAEMASAFLCAALGIVPTVRHADYLGVWLDILRADNHAIFRAASHAGKAADFIRAFQTGAETPAMDAAA